MKKEQNKIIIGTHNGIFHCDEIVAIAIIKLLYQNITEIEIIRTRDVEILNSKCNMLIDIGGNKYDHHQKGGNGKRINGVSYASAGLIWRDFGTLLIEEMCKNYLNIVEVEEIFNKIDENIIQRVDMEDNGEGTLEHPFNFINTFLPLWYEENMNYDNNFNEALNYTVGIFQHIINYNISEKLACKEIDNRIKNQKIGNILILPSQTIPWIEKVIDYNDINPDDCIDFVVFKYPAGGYALQCVPLSLSDKFSQRVKLPEIWAGETMNLPIISGIDSAILCHKGRFFARANEFADIIKMCEIAHSVKRRVK